LYLSPDVQHGQRVGRHGVPTLQFVHACSSTAGIRGFITGKRYRQLASRLLDSTGAFHGFLRTDNEYKTINFPAAIGTHEFGINAGDAIVGTYTDINMVTHGFLAVPARG